MLRGVLASLAVLMSYYHHFLTAWKPMLMCVISISITWFLSMSPCSQFTGEHPHPPVNALLARLSSLLHRFRPDNGKATELPQHSRPSAFHLHALLARLSSLIHRSPPERDAQNELQQSSTHLRLYPHVLLARLFSRSPRSRFGTDEEAEPHCTVPSSSRPGALISQLSSLFRSQPHTHEEIELPQCPSHSRVVEVAAVRDRQVWLSLVHVQSPWFNDFGSGFDCCSWAKIRESKTSI
jgi:hypothetical protein